MYIINILRIDDIISELSKIPDDSDICILDFSEVERLWPLDKDSGFLLEQRKIVHDLTIAFENHKSDVYYLSSDCNIYNRYEKWCLTNPKKELKVYCCPLCLLTYPIGENFYTNFPSVEEDDKKISNQSIENFKKANNVEKTKNFTTLVSSAKIIRLLFLDKFYNHKNFQYSFFPFHHIGTKNIKFSKDLLKIPYEWTNDGQCLKSVQNKRLALDKPHINSKNNKLENGFNFQDHQKELNEFSHKWYPGLLNKEIFNELLPIETFKSCCDVVFESYTNTDSVFFTEKTFKELQFKRPFILFGAKNQNNILKKLGFELYDEIFNYDFEKYDTLKERFESFTEQMEILMNLETKTLLKKTIDISEKLEFNFHHIKKHLSENEYYPMLDKYKNIEQKIIQDDGKLVKKALNELEKFKPLLT